MARIEEVEERSDDARENERRRERWRCQVWMVGNILFGDDILSDPFPPRAN